MTNPKLIWKREDNLSRLLQIINDKKEATFDALKTNLKVSSPTLTEYLKRLEAEKKIEHFEKPEDRRNTWYRIKDSSRVLAQIGKYEATQLIDNLSNPFFHEEKRQGLSVSAFAEVHGLKDRSKAEQSFKEEMDGIVDIFEGFQEDLKPGDKIAFVVTISGGKKNGL